MTKEQVNTMLESTGIPCAYYQFADDTGQQPPFICFYFGDSNDLSADNRNYCKIRRLVIELYTDAKDFALEETVENTLNENDLVYTRFETSLDSERMYMVVFNTSVVITEEST